MAAGQRASHAATGRAGGFAEAARAVTSRCAGGTVRGARIFWRWSGQRPFWGGLLLLLAGVEMFLSSNMDLKGVEIHIGFSGFLSYLVPAVLVLCGVLVWVTPEQRPFYGVIGTLTSIYSLIGLNFGGWFLGMLLGLVGGTLSFAWTPAPAPPAEIGKDDGITTPLVRPRTPPTLDEDGGQRRPTGGSTGRLSFRVLLGLTVPLLLSAAIALHPGRSAAAVPTAAPGGRLAAITVTTCPSTPAPTAPASRSLEDYWNQFLEWLNQNWQTFTGDLTNFWNWLTGQQSTTTPAACSGGPSLAPAPGAGTPTAPADGPGGTVVVSDHPALLTSSKQTLKDFRYEGVVSMPTAAGSIRVLKFSLSSATNADFRLLVDGADRPWATTANPLVVSGDVNLYTSRFSGRLLGIPVTFTPDSPPPLALPLPNGQYLTVAIPEIVFTDVQLNLVLITCQRLSASGMTQAFA
jgi:hypothetical protein